MLSNRMKERARRTRSPSPRPISAAAEAGHIKVEFHPRPVNTQQRRQSLTVTIRVSVRWSCSFDGRMGCTETTLFWRVVRCVASCHERVVAVVVAV
eukprot:scaffold15886_cov109-Skeletonema_dohrnii-CCMP3373.AAC.2